MPGRAAGFPSCYPYYYNIRKNLNWRLNHALKHPWQATKISYLRWASSQCSAISGRPHHSLISPAETDGERLWRQASRLGAAYAQVQETPTPFSERSWHTKGPEPFWPKCLLLLSPVLKYNERDKAFVPLKIFTLLSQMRLLQCSSVLVQSCLCAAMRHGTYALHAD